MRMLVLALVATIVACAPRSGRAEARWTVNGVEVEVAGTPRGGWCPSTKTILLEVTEDERVAGLAWRYDSLVPGEVVVTPPPDSFALGAWFAVRYVQLDEVRGYRSLAGTMQVTSVDTLRITARVTATLQRVGEEDTVHVTARFDRVPLTLDPSLCAP